MIEKFHPEVIKKKAEIEEKLKYFDDPLFIFEPKEHAYTYEGIKFDSVTTFLKVFKEEFQKEYWAERKARERGITAKEILAEWQALGDTANILGTAVHEWIEDFWVSWETEIIPDFPESPENEVQKRAEKFLDIYGSKLIHFVPLTSELKLFSKKWKLAGTVDQPLLFWDEKQQKVLLVIGDWKTNKEFKDDNHKKGRYQKLHRPFNHLYANSHNEYSLQISLYRLILEQMGIETDSGFLCHIGPEGPAKLYPAKDLRQLLKVYLDHNRGDDQIDIFNV